MNQCIRVQRRPHSQIMRLCVWDSFITDKVLLFSADNLLYSGPYSSKRKLFNSETGHKVFLRVLPSSKQLINNGIPWGLIPSAKVTKSMY